MRYNITRQVRAKKQSPFYGLARIFIVLIAIPVIAIALLSFIVYFIFSQIQLFIKKTNEPPAEPYYLELLLLSNAHVKITATEDELDAELTELNELWAEKVYHEQTYLYRAKTFPVIPAIHNKIVCFYLKDEPEGAILQLPVIAGVHHTLLPTTQLIYLQYSDLRVIPIEEVGSFYLYNDSTNEERIRGFNGKEEITLYLTRS